MQVGRLLKGRLMENTTTSNKRRKEQKLKTPNV